MLNVPKYKVVFHVEDLATGAKVSGDLQPLSDAFQVIADYSGVHTASGRWIEEMSDIVSEKVGVTVSAILSSQVRADIAKDLPA